LKIKHICFDLDGTLVQSNKTIYKATIKTLEKLNINADPDEDRFNEMIGKHFVDIFEEFNLDVPDFEKFIGIYKMLYFNFISESVLYTGVKDTLFSLKRNDNFKVTLLTTKGQDQAEKIIDHFYLVEYFDLIMGRREGIAHKPSADPLLFICNEIGVNTKETMIVGDTELDINCGKNKPDYIINEIRELNSLISASREV
jgi:HAD superfamily hydrolase (TIGR01549 family)